MIVRHTPISNKHDFDPSPVLSVAHIQDELSGIPMPILSSRAADVYDPVVDIICYENSIIDELNNITSSEPYINIKRQESLNVEMKLRELLNITETPHIRLISLSDNNSNQTNDRIVSQKDQITDTCNGSVEEVARKRSKKRIPEEWSVYKNKTLRETGRAYFGKKKIDGKWRMI
ncbi:unnamed protein product [Acanthoscelides obtectus]|uniref:Uncharacterized protein n=1 Tax=Acanthoscelides obtectus TaxID=200917 RepID=A0A9P0K1G7_ACAOB|nr:unnamed protein product [Acanthoscelides obtectus]CAK1657076.1 hypothetical protein AOBTE_LOCUS20105 [Acanthoscelides obtectus]